MKEMYTGAPEYNALKSLLLQKMLLKLPPFKSGQVHTPPRKKTFKLRKTHNIRIINNYNFTIFSTLSYLQYFKCYYFLLRFFK